MKKQYNDDGSRGDLTDEQWKKLQRMLPPQKARTGQPAADHRRIVKRSQGTTKSDSSTKNQKRRERFNRGLYRERNRVERLINRLKQYRQIATRYEKEAVNYLAMLMVGAIRLWL